MKWLEIARELVGTKELPGPANNAKIMGWGNALGAKILGIKYTADSVPWCGLFAAWCIKQAGFTPPPIAIRAKAWESFGVALPLNLRPPEGAIVVFTRAGGGHVGFVVGWHSNGDVDVLGGNQGDAVNVRRFPKDRISAFRWPKGVPFTRPAPLSGGKAEITTGEG